MALPIPEMDRIVVDLFLKKMEPIWPNLTKRQTGFDFPKRHRGRYI